MSPRRSVLIIGGGMAGAAAALVAAERGRAVTMLAKAPGATALASGAFDLAPLSCGRADRLADAHGGPEGKRTVLDRIEAMTQELPDHPLVSMGPKGLRDLDKAFRFVIAKLGSSGLEHAPFDSSGPGHLVVDGSGNLRRVATAQCTQVLGDLEPKEFRAGVVRSKRNLLVDTTLVCSGLSGISQRVDAVEVDWPVCKEAPFLLPAELGRRLDEEGERARLADMLHDAVAGKALTHLVLPPICGLMRSGEVMQEIARATGCKVVETLGGEASLPGLRLHLALRRALKEAGIEVKTTSARAGGRALEDHSGAVVLATGRFIGGGLRHDDSLTEAVFDLPVFAGRRRIHEEPLESLTRAAATESQQLFRAGVRVDQGLRPLGLGGRTSREDLFACGSVIGGHDPTADLSGLGVSVLTGYLAGQNAADWGAA